jgi:hypothetical protein
MIINKKVSIYRGSENIGTELFGNIIQDVGSGCYYNEILELRRLVRESQLLMDEKEFVSELSAGYGKRHEKVSNFIEDSGLYSFTPGGVFEGWAAPHNLISLSGIVAIPIESQEGYWLSKARWRVEEVPYVSSIWANACYNGIIVFLQTELRDPLLYDELVAEINWELDLDSDRSGTSKSSYTDRYLISSDADLLVRPDQTYENYMVLDPIAKYRACVLECKKLTPEDLNPEYFMVSLFELLDQNRILGNYFVREMLEHDYSNLLKSGQVRFWYNSYFKSLS